MAARTTQTTVDGMQQAEGTMQSARATARHGEQSVESQIGALRGTWQGDASVQFVDRSMQRWIDDCRLIGNKLDEMVQVMQGNRQTITAGESNNTQVAGSLQLGGTTSGMPLGGGS